MTIQYTEKKKRRKRKERNEKDDDQDESYKQPVHLPKTSFEYVAIRST